LLLGRAAESLDADALATNDPYLLGRGRRWVERGNPMHPENAAALVGLYLRLRGDFTFDMGPQYSAHMDRRQQYLTASWALLPAAWRCWEACVSSNETRAGGWPRI